MASGLSISGTRSTGQDVRTQNVQAAMAIANIVKTSLGPVGLDKMLVDQIGDVTITNDGATILRQLEVEHPAGKVLVELSNMQDQEVGDGTTSVVILAAELLKSANELVKKHIHPTTIISGFLLAKKEACRFIKRNMSIRLSDLGEEAIINAAKTSMSSKIIGSEADFFSKMAVDAVKRVKTEDFKGRAKYPVGAITILKAHGKSARNSELVNGFSLNCVKVSPQMPAKIQKAKIALLDFDLRKAKLALGVQVLVDDPKKLEAIRKEEGEMTKRKCRMLMKAGANVVLTTGGIDDMASKEFVNNGVMAVRRCKKSDLKKIAKLTGGSLLLTLSDFDEKESVDPATLGEAEEVSEQKVGDGELIYIKGCSTTKAQTIVLRGANDYFLDEVERSLHDAMCIVKRTLESNTLAPGGGAVESALSVHLENFALTLSTRAQMAVQTFAQALLIIPKTLSTNGAFDSTELVAKLRAYHTAAQKKGKEGFKYTGLDLESGAVRNNVKHGVLEPAMAKIKMIRFATEAAVTILRIDDAIKMNKKEDPKGPQQDHY
ncbi:hypothetical protein AAMO2058_000589200 [Amorphochlora amoebiformis]|uniref:T-complex protein 1 subunit alpha n=1 Tax=Amorphochlora amoebiformis TaxID=1561963 RepID=A0A7S0DLI8_9EUKA|mmetsp:Transcript_32780/g.52768  ORF Transcript_32780/g.52768 Transcript_32780/m.52768 type:complete len:547 (+) Transcript_32780:51-1691(+)